MLSHRRRSQCRFTGGHGSRLAGLHVGAELDRRVAPSAQIDLVLPRCVRAAQRRLAGGDIEGAARVALRGEGAQVRQPSFFTLAFLAKTFGLDPLPGMFLRAFTLSLLVASALLLRLGLEPQLSSPLRLLLQLPLSALLRLNTHPSLMLGLLLLLALVPLLGHLGFEALASLVLGGG